MADSNDTPAAAAADDDRHGARRRSEQRRLGRALWQGAVALLVAILALALAAIAGWRIARIEPAVEHARANDELAERDLAAIRAAIARLEARAAASEADLARLAALPHEAELLGNRVARIEDRVEAPQRAVARSEATGLVALADERLGLEHDVAGAIRLYQAAAVRLATANDAGALAIRAQLERDLERLRAVPQPDVTALGARLAAAGEVVRTLPMLGMIRGDYAAPGTAADGATGLTRAWQQFTTSLHELVSVRRVSDASVRLVSMEEIAVRREHLESLLFAARLAVLRGDDTEYAASIGEARDWLARFFDTRAAPGQALEAELAALAGARVSPEIPDLAPTLRMMRAVPR